VRWADDGPEETVADASRLLALGRIVAHPTETVYGLAAAADVEAGYRSLLELKGGSTPRAFLLLFADAGALRARLGELPPGGDALARAFWPGPLTLLFPAPADLPAWWAGPDGDVAARVSPHGFCRAVVERLGGPILSTSANRQGERTCRSAPAVLAAFAGSPLALVVDGGTLEGRPSTLVRWTSERGWARLRTGPVSEDAIRRALA
jgi:L-threonylcarbamoyladenylate synthase